MSFFGFVLRQGVFPLKVNVASTRNAELSAASDFDVGNFLIRLNHRAKLRQAKRYLWVRGIKPWTNWDYENKTFRFRRHTQ